ncbi:penicillin-binding transpeptidase domain-containing protein [Anaerocolumna xylanovorans]|uniref:Penicillin-binding protein 2 n=1 Tax=Anaerocolumna xylanovorans DSM 12503 TaxID=1121345 RepID=A0A1M7Y1Z4_9FIRM|nr:penicillin-binding transpeptidase domain-containing protein [Anaerocolumna xylanovorans]SHO45914.1 penicillin-binding protein 2 [Anaerocolumna xylanovorans DSM 12503]
MLDIILEKLKQVFTSRLFPVTLIFISLIAILIGRIYTLQIIQGANFEKNLQVRETREREIKSTRGNIYDRNGKLLAYNEISYSVVLENISKIASNDELNKMLFNLITILEKYGNTIENQFGITLDKKGVPQFTISDKAELRFKMNAYGKSSIDKLTEEQKNATAQEVFDFLRHGDKSVAMFNISDIYSMEESLKIMSLRYAIFSNYPPYNQIIISSKVSPETVAAIYENSDILPGVEIKQQSYRVYNDSIYNAHIIGYTGLVSDAELQNMGSDTSYNTSDMLGKLGVEKVFESYLAGKKGIETVSVNAVGKYMSTISRTEPVAGEDVYLTIDSDLQKAYYKIVERALAGVLLSKINNSADAGTRGESAKDIKIPIYDVYYALINNSVIDVTTFKADDATNLEKAVYGKYTNKRDAVLSELKNMLSIDSNTLRSTVSDSTADYLNYIESKLRSEGILLSKQSDITDSVSLLEPIDSTDEMYIKYTEDKISLSKFLQYAISKNWINVDKFLDNKKTGENTYYSTDELYTKLLKYMMDSLMDDASFQKMVYKELVYSYQLSGKEICLLLFDQGVIKYDKEDITKLESGALSPYTFITDKIRNIEITPAQLALDPCSASVVVTDVKTGEVKAMVSYPSYDNNYFANKIDYNYYTKVNSDLSQPTISRPTKQRTAPGSTFKMVTSIAALGEGVLSPGETVYDKTVFNKVTDHPPKDWSSSSHGNVDITTALEVSCNYFFYEMGWRLSNNGNDSAKAALGLERLSKYAKLLGLNEKSGIELEEADPKSSDMDAVRSAIGQGTNNYTPIQLSRYLTTVATGGTSYNLTLLDKVVDKDGKVVVSNKAKSKKIDSISNTYWDLVHQGMYEVGNGSRSSVSYIFKDFPVTVAGKTGTAQESRLRGNHALFVSYAPYEKPEISMVVVIPNGYASSNAVELSKNLYGYYFKEDGYKKPEGKAIMPESQTVSFTD